MLPNNLLAAIKGIIAGLAVYMVAFIFLGGLSGKPAMGVEAFFAFIGGSFPPMSFSFYLPWAVSSWSP